MFSQLRKRLEDGLDAVEQLAHQNSAARTSPRPSISPDPQQQQPPNGASSSPSPSPALPPKPRAESPASVGVGVPSLFAPLRSLALPRTLGEHVVPPRLSRQSSMGSGTDRELEDVACSRPALEERLKASFTIGDDSGATTPELRERERVVNVIPSTPTPIHTPLLLPLDPVDVPLPDSPPDSPYLASQIALPASPTLSATEVDHPLSPLPSRRTSSADAPPITSGNADDLPPLALPPPAAERSPSPSPSPAIPIPTTLEPSSYSTTHSRRASFAVPLSSLDDDEKIKLRERLETVEQRFSEISTSFKRLQAERSAANKLLQELTPVEGIADVDGLRNHLINLAYKVEVSAEEVKRLNGQIRQQDERMEELRETHHLEGISRSEQFDRLRKQADEAAAQLALSRDDSLKRQSELDRVSLLAREEEEKRVKAISLLKTVRQKLVKAEKERDEAVEAGKKEKEGREREREREREERGRLEGEVERGRAERERDVAGLRAQFEREVAGLKERAEREAKARKAEYELAAITTKATFDRELAARTTRIAQLESTKDALSQERDALFDQLQLRQAQVESSQSHLELLQNHVGELQYQLRELTDRLAVVSDELSDSRRSASGRATPSNPHPMQQAEIARLLSDAEQKHESRLADLRERMRILERERVAAEDEWGRNLQERSRDVERLRALVEEKDREYAEAVRGRRERDGKVEALGGVNRRLEMRVKELEVELEEGRREGERARGAEAAARAEGEGLEKRVAEMERALEELRTREAQMRSSNKTLRDELRKVQSSAALLERGRNPGVGYWSTGAGAASPRANGNGAGPATPDAGSRTSLESQTSAASASKGKGKDGQSEEEVNLEYLRNVILQFLEHKEMRPNLVRVLSVILHFTPQETRRLISKV